jgi:eukaryotic-like serine/threonine-protein kinase
MSHPSRALSNYIGIGDRLAGRYYIEDTVGSGAFGAIYSAIDEESGERVAVKALPPESEAVSETALARFQREMKIISKLIHRHIVGLYDFGQTDDSVFYMILEYVDGRPLDQVVADAPLEADQVVSVCEQIASALELAHHNGVIHRDLKPANIMLVETPQGLLAKVLDFGMAKLLVSLDDDSLPQLTREGVAVGTPRYIAPEQARGQDVGPWTDLYAVGLLMYEMLTGARAVKANDVEGAVMAHVGSEPLDLQELDQVPEAFRPILFRLIEKDPQRRYRSAEALASDLRSLEYGGVPGMGASAGPSFDPKRGLVKGSGGEAAPEWGPRSQRRAEGVAPAQRDVDEELEVDWEQQRRSASTATPMQRESPPEDHPTLFRMPRRAIEWCEALASVALGIFAFVLVTAQLRTVGYGLRVGIGLTPFVGALSWSLLSGRHSWRYSMFRLWNLFSLGAILMAHALGPRDLVVALYRNPTWFMTPLQGVVGMETLELMLRWMARWYATLLSTLMEWAFGVAE